MRVRKASRVLLATFMVALSCMAWNVGNAGDVAAYEPGPLGPVPLTWAGGGAAGGAIGTMALAPVALGGVGAGTAFVAFPATVSATALATFGAGLAVGYYGAEAACAGITAVSEFMLADSPCEPYEFVGPTAPVGVAASGWFACGGVTRCNTLSWTSLPDFAHGTTSFGAAIVDKNLFPPAASRGFQLGLGQCGASPIWGPLPYATAPNVTTCTSGYRSAASGAPYSGGWTQVSQTRTSECMAGTPGFRNCGIWPGDMFWIGRLVGSEPKFDAQTMYASGIAADPVVDARGLEARLVFRAECWNGTSSTNRSATGDWAFEDEIIVLPLNPCHDGETTKQIDIDWQTNRGLTASNPGTLTVPNVFTWDAPPEWSDPAWPHKDKVKRKTVVSDIPTLERTGEDSCEWGGDVVPVAYCTDTPTPEIVPDTDLRTYPEEAPSPTTTVPTTPTTTPATDPCAGGAPSTEDCGVPTGPGAGDPPEGGECFPSGWGWLNPVEWVLKPVKCALVWAFWDADSAAEMSGLWDDTGEPWADAVTETAGSVEFSADVGPCIPIEDIEEVCTSDVLGLELPGAVSAFIAAVFTVALVFEVVGLFARVTGG